MPSYSAGQTITGKVVCSIVNPVVCDDVSVIVDYSESIYWDAESSRTVFEGEGERRTSRTIYEHEVRQYSSNLFREVIRVAAMTTVIPSGMWSYPFR